uniref:KASH domain-containing protein n=1 Tax=Globodera rostochiensis TaxID=31243 RepID=A0A914ICC4_GLORO
MNGSPANFSKNEKAFVLMGAQSEVLVEDDQLLVEERCSALWNAIKDAANAFLAQLQSESDHLDEQLRLCSVWTALEELKRKKQRNTGDFGEFHRHQFGANRTIDTFRRWLQQKEAQLNLIKQRIPPAHNSETSLRELEQEQTALQQNIETEGRAKHQQLCSSHSNRQNGVDLSISGECERLEHRYLALWLASLESLELIHHFSALLVKRCSEALLDSELETEEQKDKEEEREGPNPKRRKTSEEMKQYMENNSNNAEGTKCHQDDHPQQQQLTDIGYSSGENMSVHDGGTNTTVSEETPEDEGRTGKSVGDGQQNRPDERDNFTMMDNSELEKSFYRMVPLDEFGQTDLDTDEGNWPRSSYWAQRFLEEVEKGCCGGKGGGGVIDLTDSLIVHVDGPESREKLNDFEEVMDLIDGRRRVDPFIEDECESQSTDDWNVGGRGRVHPPNSMKPRKRALAGALPAIVLDKTVPVQKTETDKSRQSPRGLRRKCAARLRKLSLTMTSTMELELPKRKRCVRSETELLALVDKSLGGVDSASFLLAEMNNTFAALSGLCQQLEQKMCRSVVGGKSSHKMDILKEGMEAELVLCHERMNALETTCNNLALLLGGHLNGGEMPKICSMETDERGDYLAQFSNECSRIRKELKKLKSRLDRKLAFCPSTQMMPPNSKSAEEMESAGETWKNHSDRRIERAVQVSALDSVRPVQKNSFWRSYLLLCMIGLIASFGTLFAERRPFELRAIVCLQQNLLILFCNTVTSHYRYYSTIYPIPSPLPSLHNQINQSAIRPSLLIYKTP